MTKMTYPKTYQGRLLIEEFDSCRSWPGLAHFAEKYGMSVAGCQWLLMAYRRERYLKLRRPMGRRTDLLSRRGK